MKNYIKIFSIFALGLMWINYPQTAYSLGVAPSFQSSELFNTSEMKKCSKCGEVKELVDFGNNIIMKDGLQPLCRDCKKDDDKKYRHSKYGLISQIYGSQKRRSQQYDYLNLAYTKVQFKEWIMKQLIFHILFKNWELANFDKSITPSCDRLDDYRGYSFDNIRIVTWDENRISYYKDAKDGINNKMAKPVIGTNIRTGESVEFNSCADAQRKTGIDNSHISDCCRKKVSINSYGNKYVTQSAGGYKWKFKNVNT